MEKNGNSRGGYRKHTRGIKGSKINNVVFYCVMLALPVAQFCIMWIGTNVNSIMLAFKRYESEIDVIGFTDNYTWTAQNFKDVFSSLFSGTNMYLTNSVKGSLLFYFCATLCTLPVSLLISFYFYKNFPLSGVFKVVLFIPSVIASVVTIRTFHIMANDGYVYLMKLFGKEELGLLVNGSPYKKVVIIAYNVFFSLAGGFIFFTSAMGGIDPSVSEAAQIDGVSNMKEFRYITLPYIFPTLTVFVIGGLASVFVSDYALYGFFTGQSTVYTLGYYFLVGVKNYPKTQYPFFAALGLVMSVAACCIIFVLRAVFRAVDPFKEAK